MFKQARWIGVPRTEMKKWGILQGDLNNRFAYFYTDVELEKKGRLEIQISAAARYRLWINGKSVLSGPCKGDRYRQYYDVLDVTEYLHIGRNRLAVQVLACDSYIVNNMMEKGTQPLLAYAGLPMGHRLAAEGCIYDENGCPIAVITTGIAKWKVYLEGSYQLEYQLPYLTWFGAIAERIPENAVPFGWKQAENIEFLDAARDNFTDAEILEEVFFDSGNKNCGNIGALIMTEREIPLLYENKGTFVKELLSESDSYVIDRHTTRTYIFDAGEIKTAFMKYAFSKGKGTKVTFTYAERFMSSDEKCRRDDYVNGTIEGMQDEIILDGTDLLYEPFWYRTFRFVKIEIHTGDEAAHMMMPYFMETGYPIHVQTEIHSSEKWAEDVWNICVNTLKRCMNETYMDCPYYEQMQFPMDTRLQALYTYICSGDTRLAQKAIKDFHYSMIPEGLIQGKYPCSHTQIISTFSLHYIFMLKEYYIQTGDTSLLRRYRPDIDLILDYYERKIGETGLVENLGYWEFVDWQPEWKDLNGVPTAVEKGPSTIINLMYAYALECGAYINEVTGRPGVTEEYLHRKAEICSIVKEKCWSQEQQLFKEGPSFEQYSIHAQAWAVLNGVKKGAEAGKLMRHVFEEKNVVQNSFSTSFEVFRALSVSGQYHLAEKVLELWKALPEKGCTTCPETPVDSRSECHAWSAQPIYEFIHHILGISIKAPGWKKIDIKPDLSFINDLKGQLTVPQGILKFDVRKNHNTLSLSILLPEDMEAVLLLPDSKIYILKPGMNVVEEEVRD